MNTAELIIAAEFCRYHQTEITFLRSLQESGLVALIEEKEILYIPMTEVTKLEKLSRLHYDMDINLEGLETIAHLLGKMEEMQQQIRLLNSRLSIYE